MKRQGSIYRFALLAGLLCGLFQAAPARAQDCTILSEEIVSLREPRFGIPTLWNTTYGEDGMDTFADGVYMDDGGMIAGGSFTSDEEDKVYHPLLVRLDDRGRKVWETRTVTKEHTTIDRVLKTKDGLAVIGDMKKPGRGDGIYIGFYSIDGEKKSEREFFDDKGNLNAKAFVAVDSGGFIIAADLLSGPNQERSEGLLYRVSSSGGLIWRRAYSPGSKTVFHNIQALADGGYAVSGELKQEDGRMAGWLLKVDNSGAIGWQRTFPRGSYASIRAVVAGDLGGYVLAGQTRPSGGGRAAAWLMKTDLSGFPIWQRYYVGRYNYNAHDVMYLPDGRTIALIDGDPMDFRDHAHVRVLTLAANGRLLNVEDYTDGQNANASSLRLGAAGELMISGFAQTSLPEGVERKDMTAEDVEPYMYDGWALMMPPLKEFKDPCIPVAQ